MEILAGIGWLLAFVFGLGWWIEHRGVAGIKTDLENARREIQTRITK